LSSRGAILDNLEATIAAISTAGGYHFTIGLARRGLLHYNAVPEDKFPAAFVAGADEKRKNVTNTQFRSDISVAVVGYVRTADAADTDQLEDDLDSLIADLTKAIMADITRGGNAVLTEITDIDTDKGALAPYSAVEMTVRCEYRAADATP
jgi:hypothetical protein